MAFALRSNIHGQITDSELPGQVSFIGSQNVYVKFVNTSGIEAGDTLYSHSGGQLVPALIVTNLSSASCVCKPISSMNFSVADLIIAKPEKEKTSEKVPQSAKLEQSSISTDTSSISINRKSGLSQPIQKIRGSLSAYSYSDFSNTKADNSLRFRYTLSLDARNIGDSKFSAETYISFRHKEGEWGDVKDDIFNALKIYNLALRYDINKYIHITAGRKINPKISSIGAMDGVQFEKTFNNISAGVLAGTRPDFRNYSFNSNLFQYGAYISYTKKSVKFYSESSIAFMEQKNHSITDRRFLYFQHSDNIGKKLSFFGTFELDLYKIENNKARSTFDPTGIYLSARYRMTKRLNLSGSYDARKNVIYYETYKTTIDTLMERELRQGFRLSANYRIARSIMFGLQSGYRFLKTDQHPSRNAYSYISYNDIPGINISATLSATYLESAYLNGKILGISLNRDFAEGKLQASTGYRYVDYRLPENLLTINQHIGEAGITWQFLKKMSMSLNYEGTLEQANRYNRVYFQLRKRF